MRPDRRPLPIRGLFLLGHAPLWSFVVGILAVTVALHLWLGERAAALASDLADVPEGRAAVTVLIADFERIWLASLVLFLVFVGLGSLVVGWTHRLLSRRIDGIVAHAVRLGEGSVDPVEVVVPDELGVLEGALDRVARTLAERETARAEEEAARADLVRVQRAMSFVDTESDALRVAQRALTLLLPEASAELLLADNSMAHLHRVAQTTHGPPPGCDVVAPNQCPAVHRGLTTAFDQSTGLDACLHLDGRARPCAAVCVPVTAMGRAVGVLHVTTEPDRPVPRQQVALLEALTSSLGTRLGLVRALESSQLAATTDPLTGLSNRRQGEERAVRVLASSERAAVVMGDLDHFKQLNDHHGHASGDRVLRLFANLLRSTLRPSDVCIRWGGEEFAIVLPDVSTADAVAVFDRVRGALVEACVQGRLPTLTCSFGIASFPADGSDLDVLLRRADEALYQAKAAGRDRVVAVGDTGPTPVRPLAVLA